ncbi:hypothetical protein R80B4_01172 [Fibrobacteres bacterium R8-0-B4]
MESKEKSVIEKLYISSSKSAKSFTIGSLVVLGLFVALSYGLAALALFFGKKIDTDTIPLVWFLVISTPIFLGVYFWLVAWFHKKYYIGGQIRLLLEVQKQGERNNA